MGFVMMYRYIITTSIFQNSFLGFVVLKVGYPSVTVYGNWERHSCGLKNINRFILKCHDQIIFILSFNKLINNIKL